MRIGLVPLAAKPYHIGHHALVEKAANENDTILIFVSMSDRRRSGEHPIYGWQMQDIWASQIMSILPSNAQVEYGHPVRSVYEIIENACSINADDTYTVYSDPVDTAKNYPLQSRQKYMEPMCTKGQIVFAAEEDPEGLSRGSGMPDMSGTRMRSFLKNGNFKAFSAGLPAGIDATYTWDVLRKQSQTENLIRACIKSFITG
jgi:hypothetical protein